MTKRHAVVAGGAGFLGSHLCERLLAEGYRVLCLDNLLTGREGNITHLANDSDFTFVAHDITTPIEIAGDVDLICNLASPASPPDYLRWPIETMTVGSEGTRHLLDLAQSKNARFLLASTSEVYGDPLIHPQTETYWGNVNPVGPRAVYDEAKRYAEALVTAYKNHFGTDTAIIRIFNTYGPRMRESDGRAVPSFICQALAGTPLTIHGKGDQTRSLCHVDDLIEAITRTAHSDIHGPINLGNPSEITVLELAELITELCGSSSPLSFHPLPRDDPRQRCPDVRAAASQLGWRPQIELTAGLAETIAWFHTARTRSDVQ